MSTKYEDSLRLYKRTDLVLKILSYAKNMLFRPFADPFQKSRFGIRQLKNQERTRMCD